MGVQPPSTLATHCLDISNSNDLLRTVLHTTDSKLATDVPRFETGFSA
jgi:hypothetical protein